MRVASFECDICQHLNFDVCANADSSKVAASGSAWRESASVHFTQAPVKISSRSSTPSPTPVFSADPLCFRATGCHSNAVAKSDVTSPAGTESSKSDASELPKSDAVTASVSSVEVVASSSASSSGLTFAAVVAVEKRETASQTCSAPKRQMPDSDDNVDDDEIATPLFVNKKQRMHNVDVAQCKGDNFSLCFAVVDLSDTHHSACQSYISVIFFHLG